jgi:A/G-specific adenine glycosylase
MNYELFCTFAPMSFANTLLQWFREHGRDLPWRDTSNPYAIWLSEIILQQTRIEQGLPYWERFMRRWPTVEDLAAATEDEVLKEWQGLGYYSRARNLHFAARQIVEMGGFPTTLEGIKNLKGVGDYTAAAIGSFAFGLPTAVVDGNVYRVLARHYGITTPINTTEGKKEFTALAQSLLPITSPLTPPLKREGNLELPSSMEEGQGVVGAYNQAMMDFGATQCTPTSPHCEDCPLQETCAAFREGRIDELPVKLRTLKVKERRLVYIYIRYQGQTTLHRRSAGDIWQGLYEPYWIEVSGKKTEIGEVPANLSNLSPLTPTLSLLKKNVKHILTHRILYADFYLWEPTEKPSLPDGYFWISEADRDQYAVPRLVEILFNSL